jgi:protein gp37
MGSHTKIQWTESSWTPIRARHRKTGKVGWHCTRPSRGCEFCYAEELNLRLGTGERFLPTANIEVFLDEKMLQAPLHWKTSRKVFVCSMTDLFGEFVQTEWIDRMFAVMALCQHPKLGHTFQVLTKRAERMHDYVNDLGTPERVAKEMMALTARQNGSTLTAEMIPNAPSHLQPKWPLKNVWKGVSVEDERAARNRVPILLQTEAAVRFLSCEPLLEHISLDMIGGEHPDEPGIGGAWNALSGEWWPAWGDPAKEYRERIIGGPKLDFVIIGGESGRKARPFNLDWARSLIQQCWAHQVAPFLKQIGSNAWQGSLADEKPEYRFLTKDSKGGAIEEWPKDIRVREFPA